MSKGTGRRLLGLAANRAARRDFYLASALDAYKSIHGLDDASLARELGCDLDSLDRLRLCRRPSVESAGFRTDVQAIADRFSVDALALAQLLRELSSVEVMRGAETGQGSAILMAARDRLRSKPKKDKGHAP